MLAPQCCTFSSNNVIPHLLHTIQSFHTEGGVGGGGGGGLEFPPPLLPTEILKLSMVLIVVPSILAV